MALVDAWAWPDEVLNSCIGSYDGDAYARLYDAARTREPLNRTEVGISSSAWQGCAMHITFFPFHASYCFICYHLILRQVPEGYAESIKPLLQAGAQRAKLAKL